MRDTLKRDTFKFLTKEQYRQYATYSREDSYESAEQFGLHFWDGDYILDTFWFETEEEREQMIDEFYKAHA